ncbi:hypothetical protein RD792_004776, partial [Penstemon davidsonii]
TSKLQQTVANCFERIGQGLHSGNIFTVKLSPAAAGDGRYFVVGGSTVIKASIENAVKPTPLCTTLSRDGYSVQTVEHLLSALEATGVDNCRIEIDSSSSNDSVEVPIFDGSAREWVEAIDQVGLKVAIDSGGKSCEKLAPYLNEPVRVQKNDSFIAAFPFPRMSISYGIDFPQAPAIGRQWFCSNLLDYSKQIASSRTFCIYEEVEYMRSLGLIKGGSSETAIICGLNRGWLNPPLRFDDEPCRHKVLDLIGDVSLLAKDGSQGLPIGHIIAYKAGHSLHAEFVRYLSGISQKIG